MSNDGEASSRVTSTSTSGAVLVGPASASSSESSPSRRRGGLAPGPSSSTAYAVLTHAWRILDEEGLAALTPTRLHRETGVARTTIYRHWPDMRSLVIGLVDRQTRSAAPAAPTGDISSDLVAAVARLLSTLQRRPAARLVGALLAATGTADDGHDLPSADVYVDALVAPIRALVEAGLATGLLRGSSRDAERAVADLVGPILMEVVLRGARPEALDPTVRVQAFLAAWAPAGVLDR